MSLDQLSRWAVVVIAAVALGAALDFGQGLFAPLAFGLVLGIVLSPLADWVDRIGLPRALGALLSLVIAGVAITALVLFVEPKVTLAIQRAPEILQELRNLVEGVQGLVRDIDSVRDEVADAINQEQPGGGGPAEGVAVPGAFEALSLAPAVLAQIFMIVGTVFFFLLSRHEIYDWAARRRDGIADGPTARCLKNAERQVARYFLTISMINGVFGLLIGLALHAIGMPAPYVWGVVAALLNYILYIGPAVVAASLLLAGALVFDGVHLVVPAAVYISLNALEGQFVTPTLVGRNMQVNPLLVFLSLVFWLWLWGPLGGIVAIPLLLYVLALVSGFGLSQTISFGTAGTSRPKRSAGVGS